MTAEEEREYKRAWAKKIRDTRKASGLCIKCGKPRDDEYLTCSKCREFARAIYSDLRKGGWCIWCRQKNDTDGVYCSFCRKMRATRRKENSANS